MTAAYIGSELELFQAATRWKSYVAQVLRPFVAGRVLEIGAGIGVNIRYLYNQRVAEWTSVEPDPSLACRIAEAIAVDSLPACNVVVGTADAVADTAAYETILYIDVLEHIADDRGELERVSRHLAAGGNLVVLAPAHQFLFSPFDQAIGHFRRYNRRSLTALRPGNCRLRACVMLDAAGLLASLGNAVLLKSAMPSPQQIQVWDRLLVPLSRALDRLTGYRIGKTVVAVWTR